MIQPRTLDLRRQTEVKPFPSIFPFLFLLLPPPLNTYHNALRAMSTVQRRRGKSLHLELPGGAPDERPPIVALFLIQFDVKAG